MKRSEIVLAVFILTTQTVHTQDLPQSIRMTGGFGFSLTDVKTHYDIAQHMA